VYFGLFDSNHSMEGSFVAFPEKPPSSDPRQSNMNYGVDSPSALYQQSMSSLKQATSPKRKRDEAEAAFTLGQNGADDHQRESPEPASKGPRKKKATRACAHCQKAHLTCDDCKLSHSITLADADCV
jgi:hypothetical protein